MLDLNKPIRPKEHVHTADLDDATVLLDIAQGLYWGLDSTGSRCWQLIQDGNCISDILKVMVEEYDVEEGELRDDVLAFASELLANGLVEHA